MNMIAMLNKWPVRMTVGLAVGAVVIGIAEGQKAARVADGRIEIAFVGGHETDPRDRGRPVVLVAAGLGVPPEVFREAFSHVTPAPAGQEPEPGQVRRNKEALLDALGKYGVTNERLDEVSNYYRYNPSRGELWPTTPAKAYALLSKGVVTKIVVTNPGSGYSSRPTATVPGHPEVVVQSTMRYSTDLERNGSVHALSVQKPQKRQ